MKTAFIILAVVALFSFVMNYYCCKAIVNMDKRISHLEDKLSSAEAPGSPPEENQAE